MGKLEQSILEDLQKHDSKITAIAYSRVIHAVEKEMEKMYMGSSLSLLKSDTYKHCIKLVTDLAQSENITLVDGRDKENE